MVKVEEYVFYQLQRGFEVEIINHLRYSLNDIIGVKQFGENTLIKCKVVATTFFNGSHIMTIVKN